MPDSSSEGTEFISHQKSEASFVATNEKAGSSCPAQKSGPNGRGTKFALVRPRRRSGRLLLREHLLHHIVVHQRGQRRAFRNGRVALALDDRMHLERDIDGRRYVLTFFFHHGRRQGEARLIV